MKQTVRAIGRDEVCAIESLATLPSTLVQVLSLVQDESSTALDLAEIVSSDQALAMKVLRTVNSAYYGLHRQVRTISEAVVILGFSEVERLTTSISVMSMFGKDRESVRALQLLWRHSVSCSIIAGTLKCAGSFPQAGLVGAHVAGLLHDVGKAVMAQYFPEIFVETFRLMQDHGVTAFEAEQTITGGTTHAEVGGWLAEQWELPPALVEAIALHHSPGGATAGNMLPFAVHTADAVCNWLDMGAVAVEAASGAPPLQAEPFHLDASTIEGFRTLLQKRRGLIGAMTAGALC